MSEPTPPDTTAWPRWGRTDSLKAVLVVAVGAWIVLQEGSAWVDRSQGDSAPPPGRGLVGVVQEASPDPPCDRRQAAGGPMQPGLGTSRSVAPPPLLTVAASQDPPGDRLLIPECVPLASMGRAPPTSP